MLNQSQDDQFSGSNTPNANGLFLPGTLSLAPVTEERKEKQKLKLIRASQDPYEAFKEDDFLYPTKEDEMPFFPKFCGEYQQGMPILPTGKCSLFCNLVCCFYFLVFGFVFLGIAQSITEIKLKYSDECKLNEQCSLTFSVSQTLIGPIFIYYELEEFYQSHADFASSISTKQMKGYDLTDEEYNIYCPDTQKIADLERTFNQSVTGFVLDINQKVNPCGIAAKYIFNDSFEIFETTTKKVLTINATNIAFDVDLQYKFERHPYYQFRQWLDFNDERTINWFNIQSLPLLRKLWGRYDNDLEIGNYTIVVTNVYPKEIFGGSKSIIITTLSTFGSKNYVFGILLVAVSGVLFLSAIVIYIKYKIVENRERNEQKIHADLKLKEKTD